MFIPPTPKLNLGSLFSGPVVSLAESFIDNCIRDMVQPVPGSVLYCDLGPVPGHTVEHTGIYIGNNQIVHLDGSGLIEVVSPAEFLARLDGFNTAISIYVSSRNGEAVGCDSVAERAREMIGMTRKYNVILDNCHQFTAGCLTGDFENANNFFWMVKDTAKEVLGANEWRVWEG